MRMVALCLSLAACSFSTEPRRPAGGAGAKDLAGAAARGGDGTAADSDPVIGSGGQAGTSGTSSVVAGSSGDEGGGRAGSAGGGQFADASSPGAAGDAEHTGTAGQAGSASGSDAATDAREPDAEPPASDPCPDDRLAPGDHLDLSLAHANGTRAFDIHVPEGADREPAPVLYVLHPVGTDESWNRASFVTKSDLEGFIAAFPRAQSGVWNYGDCCGLTGGAAAVDDVAFLRKLHAEVSAKACVDQGRVYATGMSAGGSLAQRLGCEAADLFVAVGTVGSVLGISADECQPSQPVAVLQIHGTLDPQVPYAGSPVTAGAQANAELWAARNACSAHTRESEREGASCVTYAPCTAKVEVTLCSIEGGGSCWFGDATCFDVSGNQAALRATDTIWTFLKRFSR